ncbi:MAG: T9SS type A sorting domain-containing protein [Cellulophaga sp.]
MKIIYLAIFMVFCVNLSAQKTPEKALDKNLKTESKQAKESNKIPGFKLYPNPTFEDVVYVTSKDNAPKKIVAYDVFGEVVLRDRISTSILNISRLTAGIYVLQVTEKNKTITRKLVVK